MSPEGGSFLASKETRSPGTLGKSKDHKGNELPSGKFGVEWRCSDGKKANGPDKPWVLPRLSYTNLIAPVMVMLGKAMEEGGKHMEQVQKPYCSFKRKHVKNYDTQSHYCFYRQPPQLMQTWSCLFPCGIKIGNEKDR